MKRAVFPFLLLVVMAVLATVVPATGKALPPGDEMNSGDVAWMLTASALVLLMTPGLSFFYGGMVSSKNVVSTMLQSVIALGVISLLWVAVGFSLAFGDDIGGVIGNPLTFFMFDNVQFETAYNTSYFQIDDIELPTNTGKDYDGGNLGHRPRAKGGYFPVAPVDSAVDIRAEMVSTMMEMGLPCDKHHHEVAAAQHELGLTFGTLTQTADRMQIYKYVVHQVAHAYGKTATFMPKPIKDDNGSGMHTHISIWNGKEPLFAGNGYAGLSDTCLYFIGGVIKHARALNAFTNPTTNSYKRLVPGFEAPVLLAYSSRNRSASCRIPYGTGAKSKRVEFRFPDAMANPYLCYAALLMAGLDGITNKIHPGEAMDKNLYDLPPAELVNVPTVCGSLREALVALQEDYEFLLKGDVFTKDQIEAYAELKWADVIRFETTPSPVEYDMYYSA